MALGVSREVVLNLTSRPDSGGVGVLTELAAGAPLSEQVPALVEGAFQSRELGAELG
jgi:hypothetical protein